MQTFFTSDTHFDDALVIQYFDRPFRSVDEMNAVRILPGNMDRSWLKDFLGSKKVQVIPPLVSLEFSELGTPGKPQLIVLCHYSMQVWERSNHGSWHLFGHTHGRLKGIGLSFEVGVDCTDFAPLSLEAVAEKMAYLHSADKSYPEIANDRRRI